MKLSHLHESPVMNTTCSKCKMIIKSNEIQEPGMQQGVNKVTQTNVCPKCAQKDTNQDNTQNLPPGLQGETSTPIIPTNKLANQFRRQPVIGTQPI